MASMELLRETSRALLGLRLDDAQLADFETYYRELIAWNRRVNLTSITDTDEVQIKHFLDSLTCLLALGSGAGGDSDAADRRLRVVDIGAGAGFPGLPLKIVRPGWELTLLDAVGKKIAFLEHLVGVLGMKNVKAIHGRAEDLGREPGRRAGYDLALARAVADLPVLAEYALPLIRVGGIFVAQKGHDIEDELRRAQAALRQLGGRLDAIIPVSLPGLDEPRHLVRLMKVAETPAKYPRRAGIPEKRPLA